MILETSFNNNIVSYFYNFYVTVFSMGVLPKIRFTL
jgi:hypothetical protein